MCRTYFMHFPLCIHRSTDKSSLLPTSGYNVKIPEFLKQTKKLLSFVYLFIVVFYHHNQQANSEFLVEKTQTEWFCALEPLEKVSYKHLFVLCAIYIQDKWRESATVFSRTDLYVWGIIPKWFQPVKNSLLQTSEVEFYYRSN